MRLNKLLKLYIPFEYLENGKLTNIPQNVIIKINDYYNEFTKKYGGTTIYDANGKYYNKEQNQVYNIKTQILEMYVSEKDGVDAYVDIMRLANYIKETLNQESVALVVNDAMRCV